jgi:uncharacterized protein
LLLLFLTCALCSGCGEDEPSGTTDVDEALKRIQELVTEQRDRANYKILVDNAEIDIGQYWSRTIPSVYSGVYRAPEIRGSYDPRKDVVLCGGEDVAIPGNALFCPPGNFIAWDELGFFYPMYKNVAFLAPAFILAHEWGHAIQQQLGLPRTAYESPRKYELGADCLAGAWARDAALRGRLTREHFDRALDTMISLQDKDDLPWLDPTEHGTAFERSTNFGDGARAGPTACIRPAQADPTTGG